MLGFINKLFDTNDKDVKKIEKQVIAATNALEKQMEQTPDLVAAFAELKRRHLEDGESLDDLMPEAFALTRESAKRNLGVRHYDVQLVGAAALHQGKIAEMKTGEGKTYVATLALALNALTGKGCHLVTTNEYLAETGADWMGPIFRGLGLSVAVIKHSHSHEERRAAYRSDITYITNSELGFDYLRDNMAFRPEQLVLRESANPLHFAIIDEVDSILIDEARTPLIISGPAEAATDMYYTVAKMVKNLERGEPAEGDEKPATGDYSADEKTKDIHLTEQGIAKAEQLLGIEDLFSPKNMEAAHMLRQGLRAKEHYALDQEYVKDEAGQIVIVDEFTGRLMPGRRFGEGLHQAIEAKEGVKIERENQTLATVTYQNFFKLYDKISGMTGTAKTEEKEFQEIYASSVLTIPTNKPVIRKDYPDIIYRSKNGKYEAIIEEIAEVHETGQPVLVGTVTIEASETLGRMLKKKGVPHNVLNAKYHEKEAEIISQAGRKNAVTISTNMAGRGTDIVLGGNPEALARQELVKLGFERYDRDTELFIKSIMLNRLDEAKAIEARLKDLPENIIPNLVAIRDMCVNEHEEVLGLGGLHIIGTERHESRRIDNQLRGRAGRQGDPGSSRFYVSFDDDLIRLFASDRVVGVMDRFGMDDSIPIENRMVTGAIENAQKRVEDRNFGIRKQLLEYDNIMSKQREVIYEQRRAILLGNNIKEDVLDMMAEYVDGIMQANLNPQLEEEERDIAGVQTAMNAAFPQLQGYDFEQLRSLSPDEATDHVWPEVEKAYEAHEAYIAQATENTIDMRAVERYVVLQVVDKHWKEHLHNMDVLRQGIGLRGYGQKNPLQEYGSEGFNLFTEMKESIRREVAQILFRIEVNTGDSLEREQQRNNKIEYSGGDDDNAGAAPMTINAPRNRGPQPLNRAQRRRQEKAQRKNVR